MFLIQLWCTFVVLNELQYTSLKYSVLESLKFWNTGNICLRYRFGKGVMKGSFKSMTEENKKWNSCCRNTEEAVCLFVLWNYIQYELQYHLDLLNPDIVNIDHDSQGRERSIVSWSQSISWQWFSVANHCQNNILKIILMHKVHRLVWYHI